MTKPLIYNARIAERVDLTDALSIFRIAPDHAPTRPWFTPGQYCVIGLNNVQSPSLGPVSRAMSIASAPEAEGPLEFYIRRVARPQSPNPLTHLLWGATTGDRLYLRCIAAGTFTIEDTVGTDDPRMRVMVAGGTGVAPFVSMIRSEVCRNPHADLSRWVLLHGVSYRGELGYRDELLQLSKTNGLKYWGTVSRPGDMNNWTGDVGRVDSFFEPARLLEFEQRLGFSPFGFVPLNVVVLVCGPAGTIVGTMTALLDRGFVPHAEQIRRALRVPSDRRDSLFFESYEAQPLIDVDDPTVICALVAAFQNASRNSRTMGSCIVGSEASYCLQR